MQGSMKIVDGQTYRNFYFESYSILFLKKIHNLLHFFTSVPHNVIFPGGITSVATLLSHNWNCAQLHLQFVLITEDGTT